MSATQEQLYYQRCALGDVHAPGIAAALGSSTIRRECVFAHEPTLHGVVLEKSYPDYRS
jgi:hypothetical protein